MCLIFHGGFGSQSCNDFLPQTPHITFVPGDSVFIALTLQFSHGVSENKIPAQCRQGHSFSRCGLEGPYIGGDTLPALKLWELTDSEKSTSQVAEGRRRGMAKIQCHCYAPTVCQDPHHTPSSCGRTDSVQMSLGPLPIQ